MIRAVLSKDNSQNEGSNPNPTSADKQLQTHPNNDESTNDSGNELPEHQGDAAEQIEEVHPDPCAKLRKDTYEVGKAYQFDDLMTFFDSNGNISVTPGRLKISPSDRLSIDDKHHKILFLHPGIFTVSIDFEGKAARKKKSFEQPITVIAPKITEVPGQEQWIASLVSESAPVDATIAHFRTQLNRLHNMGGFDVVLVASLRSFVELLVKDIATKTSVKVSDSLKTTYSNIMDNQHLQNYLFENVGNQRTSEGLQMMSKLLNNSNEETPLIDFLNLTTHQATKFLKIADVDRQDIFFRFIYTYFVVVNNTSIS